MKKEVIILLAVVAIIAIAGVVGASYYRESVQKAPQAGVTQRQELVRSDSATIGPADAKVTIVEFYDPECEACASFHPSVKALLKEFEGKVRYVARYAPFHKNAKIAAIYTEAAGEQGKYWDMQQKLFEKQGDWGEKHGEAAVATPVGPPTAFFDKYAQDMGLNVEQLKASVSDPKHGAKVDRDMSDARAMGVNRTPTFFVNGRKLARLAQLDLRALIVQELAKP